MDTLSPKQLVREAAKTVRLEQNVLARELKAREREQVRNDKASAKVHGKIKKADAKLNAESSAVILADQNFLKDDTEADFTSWLICDHQSKMVAAVSDGEEVIEENEAIEGKAVAKEEAQENLAAVMGLAKAEEAEAKAVAKEEVRLELRVI
jgi:hypothetical protein